MNCSKCGAEIKEGNIYCSECGEEVVIVPEYNVMEDASFLEYMKTIEPGDEEEEQESEEVVNPGKKLGLWISICTAVFILSFAGIVVAGMQGLFDVSSDSEMSEADERYLLAMEDLASGDYDAAINSFARTAIDSDDINPYIYQYEIYLKTGDKEAQRNVLETILNNDPDNIPATRNLIDIIVEERDFKTFYQLLDEKKELGLEFLFVDYIISTPKFVEPSRSLIPGDTIEIQMEEGQNVYYTMDGTDPVENGHVYYIPISIPEGETTIRAVSTNAEGYYSKEISTTVYADNIYDLPMPTLYPESGEYTLDVSIKVDVPNGCVAYYTWDGTNPTVNSDVYSTGIKMPVGNNVLSVMIVDEYGNTSPIKTGYYRYMPTYVEE